MLIPHDKQKESERYYSKELMHLHLQSGGNLISYYELLGWSEEKLMKTFGSIYEFSLKL